MKSLLWNLQLYFGNNSVRYAEVTWVMLGPYQLSVWGRQSPLGNPTRSQGHTARRSPSLGGLVHFQYRSGRSLVQRLCPESSCPAMRVSLAVSQPRGHINLPSSAQHSEFDTTVVTKQASISLERSGLNPSISRDQICYKCPSPCSL